MNISKETINARVRRGMNKEDAQTLPLQWHRKLTIDKVNEIKKHGLTLSSAAVALDTSSANLSNFLKQHNIEWPSKGICYKAGCKDPNSVRAKCEALGVSEHTVWAHMRRKGLCLSDAIELAQNAKRRRQEVGKVKQPYPYDLVKRRLKKEDIVDCERIGWINLKTS